MPPLTVIIAVAIGGAAGALARFGITQAIHTMRPGMTFPLGTFITNIIGCLAIGFCFYWLSQRGVSSPAFRVGIQVGLIGAMTTFSTYSIESLNLLAQRQYTPALLNIIGSVVLGLIAVWGGIVLARAIFGPV